MGGSLSGLAASVMVVTALATGIADQSPAPECQPGVALGKLEGLPEASGLALSRTSPGRLWTHNDSGEPVVFSIGQDGRVSGRVRISGAGVDDWEAMAVGPCGNGACLYVADIGDNDANRRRITVYRVPEPGAADRTAEAKEAFHATYPDRAHDAETLLVGPDGTLYIVTKGETGGVGLYRFPSELRAGATHRLEQVGKPRDAGSVAVDRRVTDGSVSNDGRWVVLRSKTKVWLHRAPQFFAGSWTAAREIDVTSLGEPQGEGVAMDAKGTIYLAGEGGSKSRPGTLGRVSCGA